MSTNALSDELARTREAFDAWRSTRTSKNRIPEHLWEAAIRLAGVLPQSVVARELHLSATDLKKRCQARAASAGAAPTSTPRFLELCLSPTGVGTNPAPAPSSQAPAAPTQIRLDRPDGARLSITIDSAQWTHLQALCVGFLRG